MIIFSFHLGMLILMSWFVAQRTCQSFLDRVLAVFILVWTNVVITALFLSCYSLFGDSVWYFRTSILIAALTAFACRKVALQRDAPICEDRVEGSIKLMWLRRILVGTFLIAFGLNLFICLKYSPNNWDSLTYHMPRIHFYLAQGHLGHFDTLNLRQIFFPFNATIFQSFLVMYGQSDKLLNCFNLACWVFAIFAVYALGRRCELSHTAALVAAWIGGFAGQVFAQATATTNDLLAATPFLIGVVFAIDWWRERRWLLAFLSAAAFGLAIGTKLTMAFFAPGALLICGIWLLRLMRQKRSFPAGRREALQIIAAVLLVVMLVLPFLAINYYYTKQLSPEHYNYLLNRPFSIVSSLQTIYTYSVALLLDPMQYFAIKADSAWKFRLAVEPTLRKVLFPFWNREHAVNDLYVFGTDISEDGVFYGFSVLLIAGAFIHTLWQPELRCRLAFLLALVGVGWFLTYATVSKWSLFNQRYFMTAFLLCMPLIGQLFQSVRMLSSSWRRNAAFGLFGFVMISALLFSYSYLLYNTPRSIKAIGKAQFNRGKIAIPPVMESVLSLQKKVRFVFSGYTHEDERLYQFMNRGKEQRFSIGQQRADDWYNVFTFWAPIKQAMFSNIPSSSAYTFFRIPGKVSPGVSKLGEFGDGMSRYHYYGINLLKRDKLSSEKDDNILVRLIFDRFSTPKDRPLENRLRSIQLDVIGLNIEDNAVLKIYYTDTNNRNILLTEAVSDFSSHFIIPEKYRRLYITASPAGSRKIIAESEICIEEFGHPRLGLGTPPVGEIDWDIIVEPHPGGMVLEGLGPPEGPYIQWELPHVRWAVSQQVKVMFAVDESHRKRGPLSLKLSFRPQVRKAARMDLLFNGSVLKSYAMNEDRTWIDDIIMLAPVHEKNILELRIDDIPPIEESHANNLYMLFRQFHIRSNSQ